MKSLALLAFVVASSANASPWHCYGPMMTHQRNCHICQKGPWYDIKEYECSAAEEARQDRARAKR